LREIQEAFRVFAARLPADALLVVNEAYAPVFAGDGRIRARTVTFGFGEGAHWRLGEPEASRSGVRTRFTLEVGGRPWGEVEIPLLGRHMALDAAAAAVALDGVGLDAEEIRAGLAKFCGVGRRLEVVADRGGILLLDDYGHHPAEIRATVRALRHRYDGRRLLVIFQPHQASRTRCLMKEFAAALAEADHVLLPPIFFARDSEEERRRVTAEDLAAHIRNEGGRVTSLPDLASAVEGALAAMAPGDIVVTMGAGNVDEVAHGLAERLR
ncbi:MAG: glutamate ligase domain-containing protein, partial [Planctomycetota bacterium]